MRAFDSLARRYVDDPAFRALVLVGLDFGAHAAPHGIEARADQFVAWLAAHARRMQ